MSTSSIPPSPQPPSTSTPSTPTTPTTTQLYDPNEPPFPYFSLPQYPALHRLPARTLSWESEDEARTLSWESEDEGEENEGGQGGPEGSPPLPDDSAASSSSLPPTTSLPDAFPLPLPVVPVCVVANEHLINPTIAPTSFYLYPIYPNYTNNNPTLRP
ncbi:hypothetical protein AAFF_G00303710 [Aldrovandia affinis]|uniref:Uncharacterized protein n=1 Tax=Aldrovandia affinis TaxID=143900 RepID=A0AAD7RAP8_9TELE|nr:hypothetical protein AAFF_G00303710 [Aldrovandia affinis]